MKKTINVEELKQIQLDILNFVDGYCKKNNLKYYLAYGTLLGAVRHKGYIPWDDDIDILMFREDYEKFVTTFKDERYKVFATEVNDKYPYPFAKVGDTTTYFEEEIKDVIDTGVNIDVFPLDYLPEDKVKIVTKKRDFLQKIWIAKRLPRLKRRGFVKNSILALSQFVLSIISVHKIVASLERNAQLAAIRGGKKLCGNLVYGAGIDVYPISDYDKSVNIEFEGKFYPCPHNYDDVLTIMYGDYLQLPPKDKQVSHHHFVAYWK